MGGGKEITLISQSSGDSVASAGDELTSISQGLSSSSIMMSKPKSSNPEVCAGILGHKASTVRTIMLLMRPQMPLSSIPLFCMYSRSLETGHLLPAPDPRCTCAYMCIHVRVHRHDTNVQTGRHSRKLPGLPRTYSVLDRREGRRVLVDGGIGEVRVEIMEAALVA